MNSELDRVSSLIYTPVVGEACIKWYASFQFFASKLLVLTGNRICDHDYEGLRSISDQVRQPDTTAHFPSLIRVTFVAVPEGMYVSHLDKGSIREVLKNWPLGQESRICVVTDGSRILGTVLLYNFCKAACSLVRTNRSW